MTDTGAEFDEFKAATELLDRLTTAARRAIKNGVDKDWANARLNAMGAKTVQLTSTYKVNVPVTALYGVTVQANSREDAEIQFRAAYEAMIARGSKMYDGRYWGDNVYRIVADAEALVNPTFFEGPEDAPAEPGPVLGVDETKAAIRAFLKAAVVEQGWGHSYAQNLLNSLGIETLPELRTRQVTVPVGGTVEIIIRTFDDSTDEDMQKAAASTINRNKHVYVQAEEVGLAQYTGRMLPEDDPGDPF